jgi:hypothetical protein
MRLPNQSPTIVRQVSAIALTRTSIVPSDCSVLKKIACAGALAACAAVCVGSVGAACAECLAGIGASGCIDCI